MAHLRGAFRRERYSRLELVVRIVVRCIMSEEIEKIVKGLIWDMSAKCYDDMEEKQRIRENLDVEVLGGGKVKLSLRNFDLFEETLILVGSERYANGSDSDHISKTVRLTAQKNSDTVKLTAQDKFITASVDRVYAPIMMGGFNHE